LGGADDGESPDASNWHVVPLAIAATMLFRWQGNFWSVTVAKLVILIRLVLVAVTILGIIIARVG
jgi:hypothetical protein